MLIAHDSSILTHSRTVERDGKLVTERCPGSRAVVVADSSERVRLALAPVREVADG
jgi:riboflavin biosynthesis pyrimidine reductase